MNVMVKQQESDSRLASNLHLLLKNRGLTENELAQALDIPLMTVRRIVSGETENPRVSTLKLIANYLKVSMDLLMGNPDKTTLNLAQQHQPIYVPILDWEIAEKIASFKNMEGTSWSEWQPIPHPDSNQTYQDTFALKSLPSMHPRFPKGTLFILSPHLKPTDGDIVLIKIRQTGEIALKDLKIDPPEKNLVSLVDAQVHPYKEKSFSIIGVVLLTLLFTKRNGY